MQFVQWASTVLDEVDHQAAHHQQRRLGEEEEKQKISGNSSKANSEQNSPHSSVAAPPLPSDVSSAAAEISGLRQVWHETRAQLAKARHLLTTQEETFKAKWQSAEIKQMEEIESVKKEYEGKLAEIRSLVAANQAEFESALMTKKHFQQGHERENAEITEKLKAAEALAAEQESRARKLEEERDRLSDHQHQILLAHRETLERLRAEEAKRFSALESELKGRLNDQWRSELSDDSGSLEFATALASTQRALDEKSRQLDRTSAEKRWLEADLQSAQEQINAAKERSEAEQLEFQSQLQSFRQKLHSASLRVDEGAAEISRQGQEILRLQQNINELEFQLASEKNRAKADRTQELEGRIKAMSDKLMEKGSEMEILNADRAALRLRLERLELKYQLNENHLKNIKDKAIARGQLDLEDDLEQGLEISIVQPPPPQTAHSAVAGLRSRFPRSVGAVESASSIIASPAVKRALRFFDGIGVQVGVLLRRYPQARLGFGLYVIFLHLWLFFIISHFIHHNPIASPGDFTQSQFISNKT